MRRSIRYSPERRRIMVRVPQDKMFPWKLFRMLCTEGLIESPEIDAPGRRKKTLTIILAEHDDLPSNNLLGRLAYRLSRIPGHRVVHDPWEIGGRPVNIDLAVELVVEAILGFNEDKLRECAL